MPIKIKGRQVDDSARHHRAIRPQVVPLEDRRLPAVFMVNSLADFLTPPAGTPPGTLTLREAIQAANDTVAPNVSNTIELTVAGTYAITTIGGDATDNSAGEFDIDDATGYNLTIVNLSGGRAVVDGGGLNRVFDINEVGQVSNGATVTFQDLTITDGVAPDSSSSSSSSDGCGGGILAQQGVNIVLDDVDMTDNFAEDGGAVYIDYGTLTIVNGTFLGNVADDGGAVYSEDVTTISDSFFQGNLAYDSAGALYLGVSDQSSSDLSSSVTSATVTGSNFVGNVASAGGAIYEMADVLMLQYCTLDLNRAVDENSSSSSSSGDGGALEVTSSSSSSSDDPVVTVANCLLSNDVANDGDSGFGGGICVSVGTLTVLDSQFQDDGAQGSGGAINFVGSTLTMTGTTIIGSRTNGEGGALFFLGSSTSSSSSPSSVLTNDTLTLNSAYYGGGIYDGTSSGDLTLLNDTINANYAVMDGGGIDLDYSSSSSSEYLAIQNTIIAQDTVGTKGAGPDVYTASTYSVTDDGGNLVGNDSGSLGFNPGTLIGTPARMVNPDLGPLLDNGAEAPFAQFFAGKSPVMYEAGAPASLQVVETEALLPGSPAFSTAIASGAPNADERGFSRPAANPSIGAYQPEYAANATSAQIYVEDLYEILFNRVADQGGLAYWTPQVSTTSSNNGLLKQLESAPEYRTAQIDLFYGAYLDRAPDGGGVSYWLAFLNNGGTLARVQQMFLGSTEYYSAHGGNPVTVVESMYENVLNRIPLTAEVDSWVRVIQGGSTPDAVALDFILSSEYEGDLIEADYTGFLGRAAAATEVDGWLGYAAGSVDPNTVLIEVLLGSPEAFSDRT